MTTAPAGAPNPNPGDPPTPPTTPPPPASEVSTVLSVSDWPAEAVPTSRWLAATADVMPALTGPAGVAERLLLLVHYGIDWSTGWVARYRNTYWDSVLPDRVICATYRSATLRRWWRDVADDLGSQPRSAGERAELEALLRADSQPVLEVLRFETEALLLRTRIVADAVRRTRPPAHTAQVR